jgi:ABC-2 type transport system ATP-binding protein
MNGKLNTEPVITVSGLSKHYKETVAVQDLSLNISRGEIYGFLGLNGAGKTTTIRMLLGIIRPTSGFARMFGHKINAASRDIWSRVGYFVDVPASYPDLSVRENLEIIRRLRGLSDNGTVENIMEKLVLTQYADRRAGTLSHGNAQRLGLAKALIHRPDLLILDEPANGLDPAGIVEIRNLLRDLADEQGVTIFMSSHILSEVHRLATRIGVIHKGRLIKEFDALELAAKEQPHLLVDVHDRNAAMAALKSAGISASPENKYSLAISDTHSIQHPDEIATLLVNAGSPPTRLVTEQKDLEAYFLDLVGIREGKNNE